MVSELGVASCPICGTTIHAQRVVCRNCHQLTDGLRPGFYYEGLERRSDPMEGRLQITSSQVSRWKQERNLRVKRRELQRLARELEGGRQGIGEFLPTLNHMLSKAFSHYFDALDAAETIRKEVDLIRTVLGENTEWGEGGNVPDLMALDRAGLRLKRELDHLFGSLSGASASLDKVAGLDKLLNQ